MRSSENRGWKYLKERFGIGRDELEHLDLEKRSGDLWLVSGETELKSETRGFRLLRSRTQSFKPTTYAMQFLGDRIEKNLVELDRDELLQLLDEEMVERKDFETGYVALKFDGKMMGCGFYKNGKVSSRIPKNRARELKQIIS